MMLEWRPHDRLFVMSLSCHCQKSTSSLCPGHRTLWARLARLLQPFSLILGTVALFGLPLGPHPFAQTGEDWLSHLHPEEAALHSQAYQQHVDEILSQGNSEALRQLAIMSVFSRDWMVAAQAAERFRLQATRFDLVPIEISAWSEAGDQTQALDVLNLALGAPEGEWTGWSRLTELMWAIPSTNQALDLLDALDGSVNPESKPWVRMETRIRLLRKNAQAPAALELIQTLLANAPNPERVELGLKLARGQGESGLALAMMDDLLPEQKNAPEFAIWRAELNKDLGQLDEAIAALQTTQPTPEVLFYLGTTAQAAGEDEIAQEAWSLLPVSSDQATVDSKDAYYTAHLAQSLGYFGQAWTWFGRVTEPPWKTEALLARGLLLNQFAQTQGFDSLEGSLQQVLEGLEQVRSGDDEQTRQQAWAIEALLLRQARQSDRFIERVGQALAEDPDNESLLYLRALEALRLERLSLAEQDLRRIIRVNRYNADALNALGYMLADRTQRFHEAHRLIEQALKLEPNSPEILDSMGWVNFRLGRLTLALDYLEKAHALKQDPEIQAHLIQVLEAQGQYERAKALASSASDQTMSP